MAGNLELRRGKVEPSAHNPYVVGSSPTAATNSLSNNNLTVLGHGVTAVAQAFWSQVYKTDYCWFWIGYTAPSGYGHFSINGKPLVAHKYAYQEAHGAVPSGLELHHDCQTKNCVNPEHLIVASHSEHMRIHAQYRSLKGMAQ